MCRDDEDLIPNGNGFICRECAEIQQKLCPRTAGKLMIRWVHTR